MAQMLEYQIVLFQVGLRILACALIPDTLRKITGSQKQRLKNS